MKTYEIEGVRIISNLYQELRVNRINKRIEKLSPYIIVVFLGFVIWFSQMVIATASVPTYTVINTYHVK